jgi:3-methyladenine DNA glycosylase AlkD
MIRGVPDDDAAALADELLARLRALANPDDAAGMARFGISPVGTLGVSMTPLRAVVAELRPQRRSDPGLIHEVAARLWASGIHEARILASLVDVPALVTRAQADAWVADLDSWDTCDQLQHLVAATPFAYEAVPDWIARDETFVRRAGLVLLCTLAVHDKRAPDERLTAYLPLLEGVADDERTYVTKAVSWALRQVGKRSAACHSAAVASAERILAAHPGRPSSLGSRAARWAANDALRELRGDAVRSRLGLA